MNIKAELGEYVLTCRKINTHCHHMNYRKMREIGLSQASLASYIGWCFGRFDSPENIRRSFDAIRLRSYYRWFNAALKRIYNRGDLDASTFDCYNALILENEKNDPHYTRFRQMLNYEHILEDAYWNYGDNLGDAALFTPSFRVNIFLNGYRQDFVDQDGHCILEFFEQAPTDIDRYCEVLRQTMRRAKESGAVAFKCAIAYERGLDFYRTTRDAAQRALLSKARPTERAASDFQSYIFYQICENAAALDMPLQIHTGLGQLDKTGALHLTQAVKDHPRTRFVIFHMSFPNYFDALSLAHNFSNVFVDLCWIPLISDCLAVDCLKATLDMVNLDRISWGCDTWTFEESFGAVLAAGNVLGQVLGERVAQGELTREQSKQIIDRIMYLNAKELYAL